MQSVDNHFSLFAFVASTSLLQGFVCGRSPFAGDQSTHTVPGTGDGQKDFAQKYRKATNEGRHCQHKQAGKPQDKINTCDRADKASCDEQSDEQCAKHLASQGKIDQPHAMTKHFALLLVSLSMLMIGLVKPLIQHTRPVYCTGQAVDEYADDGRHSVKQKHRRDRQLNQMGDVIKP